MIKTISDTYLKQNGHKIPKNAKYHVSLDTDKYQIIIKTSKKVFYHDPREFVMYQIFFNDKIMNYPGYVHLLVYLLIK